MEFSVGLGSPFSLDYTLESGQVFRWENRGEWWYGQVGGGVIKARQEGETLRVESSTDELGSGFVRSYFRTEDDLLSILATFDRDPTISAAIQKFYGLRLIHQDFWECLASFVLATNAHIPRIRKMIESVCSRYGTPVEYEGLRYSAFPDAQRIADAGLSELNGCGLGYRAPFLKKVAESVVRGDVDGSELSMKSYPQAHEMLLRALSGVKVLPGVGPKVADCVLLFSCAQDEAFPIDVWIARELALSYPRLFRESRAASKPGVSQFKLTPAGYRDLSTAARKHFGPYAGLAQQYLYMLARERQTNVA